MHVFMSSLVGDVYQDRYERLSDVADGAPADRVCVVWAWARYVGRSSQSAVRPIFPAQCEGMCTVLTHLLRCNLLIVCPIKSS